MSRNGQELLDTNVNKSLKQLVGSVLGWLRGSVIGSVIPKINYEMTCKCK